MAVASLAGNRVTLTGLAVPAAIADPEVFLRCLADGFDEVIATV